NIANYQIFNELYFIELTLKYIHRTHVPLRYSNGDTRKELLMRSRYLLFKSADKWTERQKQRAKIVFEEYPDIKQAYNLCHSLRMIFSKNTIKDAARLLLARWYNEVENAGIHSFNVIASTFYEHYDEILNFYNNRSTNAMAESFNSKIKLFRANLRGVADKKFFLFRIAKLFAYPH
ncbi:MAG: transposase, partial [Candidatus Onthomorpha sp.]